MGLHQTKKFLHINKMKRQSTEWENRVTNDTSGNRLINKIYKEFIQLDVKKTVNRQCPWWSPDLPLTSTVFRWSTPRNTPPSRR